MRDEMDGRIWNARHEDFSGVVEEGLHALARRLRRVEPGRAVPGQLIAVLLAAGFSLITIGGTVA